jgi:hypothetical protein
MKIKNSWPQNQQSRKPIEILTQMKIVDAAKKMQEKTNPTTKET